MKFMPKFSVLVLALVLFSATAMAQGEVVPGPVRARVVRVIDGDTLSVSATIWPGASQATSVRIAGIDAPELTGRCDSERKRAQAAKRALADLVAIGSTVFLREVRPDKYGGRVVAHVGLVDGRDVGKLQLAAHHARPYDGGKRQPWC
ncbi:MAG: thermonuclease family protein [Burkholderiales bacterium]